MAKNRKKPGKWGADGDLDGDGIPNKKDKDKDGDGIPNKRDPNPNKPNRPRDPNRGGNGNGGGGDGNGGGGNGKGGGKRDPQTSYYNIFSETPDIDETGAESIAEFAENLRENLQSRSQELIARFSINEVDKLPKNYARAPKYNDEDRPLDFDSIIAFDTPENNQRRIPDMVDPLEFTNNYVFGHATVDDFIEGVPIFLEDGSVEWHLKLSITDTIGVSDYIIEIAGDD